ncbi:CRISPR-associated Csd1 family protein [Cohnella sp. SGD-V74]|uniref:type I-C CRISPR-associated protein Cas8c/Csd1 n=1 Tax=unclassified Cohnella TaxID=2636738 RepID=UPI000D439636|nr:MULTISPECIES: type I-C CRISPR-associated protein Cas8c/Csd1 [unclassified Cohnella]PRX71641.1 CRISPR-associated Csd1 family protein [Cohnella sp. SGD-V74]
MIIQALHQRYLDLANDSKSEISPLYFSSGKVSYVLEIDEDGTLVEVVDIRDTSGKKKRPETMNLPEQTSRSSGIAPYFLSDKAEYILGYYPLMPQETETQKKASDARRKHEASKALACKLLHGLNDISAKAILGFYDKWQPEHAREHPLLVSFQSELDKGIDTNMVFHVVTQETYAHDSPAIKDAWIRFREQEDTSDTFLGQCLLTGDTDVPIARTHDKIKGIRGAQSAGASLISFNFRSAESYGKDSMQSYNSPVSKTAMFGYTTALNHLLASSRNRTLIGDMTVVFWSGKPAVANEVEPILASFFSSTSEPSEDLNLTEQINGILQRARKGKHVDTAMLPHSDTPFHVLGLSPNNARTSVRFYWQGNFGDLVVKLGQHASDFALDGYKSRDEETPTTHRILQETMRVGGDGSKVGEAPPSQLGGELFRAVIEGMAYPYSLLTLIVNRIRADGIINTLRASIIKAYLLRYNRIQRRDRLKEELTVSLNLQAKEPAYRLGRLFAVLERAQQEAAGGAGKLNATIKDRYFSTASSNPAAVFPVLLKLSQHHLSKSKFGDFRDREMQDIMQEIRDFPVSLDLHQQGIFILGYYHQKHNYYTQIKAATEAKQEIASAATEEG